MGKSKELAELGNAVTQSGGTTTFSDDTTAIVSTQSGSVTLQNYAYATGFTYDLSNAAQAHSVGTSSSAPTILKTSNVERMRIDASGRVTMPYQPFFYARAGASRDSVSGILTYNNVIHNVGSHYDGTNKFTAPIAGVYLFKGQAYKEGSNGTLRLRVNGSNVEEDGRQIGGTTTHSSMLTIAIYKLSASDFVQLYADYNSHQNPNYSVFSGMLLG